MVDAATLAETASYKESRRRPRHPNERGEERRMETRALPITLRNPSRCFALISLEAACLPNL